MRRASICWRAFLYIARTSYTGRHKDGNCRLRVGIAIRAIASGEFFIA